MSVTPEAIQELLDELECSKQSRLRAWAVLQRIRAILSELGNVVIDPPAQKTFDAEGALLEETLKSFYPIGKRFPGNPNEIRSTVWITKR
jgi:hypothetical protein